MIMTFHNWCEDNVPDGGLSDNDYATNDWIGVAVEVWVELIFLQEQMLRDQGLRG